MSARRTLYRIARVMGDAEAARQGPTGYGKRVARRAVYRRTNRWTRQLLRAFGLSR
jgi:hypothetical protein